MSRARREPFLARHYSTISALADCLAVGVMVFLTLLPVVTAFAGFVAGCAILRRRAAGGGSISPVAFWREFVTVLRSSILVVVVPTLVALAIAVDLLAVAAGMGENVVLTAAFLLVAVVAGVLALRAAAAWRPGAAWPATVRDSFAALAADGRGTLALFGGLATALALGLLMPALAFVCLGPLVLAAVAVDTRRAVGTVAHE
jgi:hypothetical protein